jgi:DNA-binding NarL/FixJ family response regulator
MAPGHDLMEEPARVLIVEDHPLYADGLRALIEGTDTLELTGIAHTAAQALVLAREQQADLIMLDVSLGQVNGLDLVNQLRRISPASKIVILTAHEDHEIVVTAMRLGVQAYLTKDASGEDIIASLKKVQLGERYISQPHVLTEVLTEFSQLTRQHERDRLGLTDLEIEVLRLAAAGLNNRDIGTRQFWSEITVKRKMQDIYRKLGVKNRAQAVAEAMRLGFI